MKRYRALPERIYAHTDAYNEHLGVSLKPLPVGPRLMGEESEYVRADIHAGAVEAERQRIVDLIQEAAAEHPDPSRARKALLSVAIDIALSDTDGWR